METESMPFDAEKFNQLLCDVALIKEILIANRADSEGELTDWVQKKVGSGTADS